MTPYFVAAALIMLAGFEAKQAERSKLWGTVLSVALLIVIVLGLIEMNRQTTDDCLRERADPADCE